jgi:serine phosphatase RsbU (regulator of sigma subunit)
VAILNRGIVEAGDRSGRPLDLAALGTRLAPHRQASAERLIELVLAQLAGHAVRPNCRDRAILVIRRM